MSRMVPHRLCDRGIWWGSSGVEVASWGGGSRVCEVRRSMQPLRRGGRLLCRRDQPLVWAVTDRPQVLYSIILSPITRIYASVCSCIRTSTTFLRGWPSRRFTGPSRRFSGLDVGAVSMDHLFPGRWRYASSPPNPAASSAPPSSLPGLLAVSSPPPSTPTLAPPPLPLLWTSTSSPPRVICQWVPALSPIPVELTVVAYPPFISPCPLAMVTYPALAHAI